MSKVELHVDYRAPRRTKTPSLCLVETLGEVRRKKAAFNARSDYEVGRALLDACGYVFA